MLNDKNLRMAAIASSAAALVLFALPCNTIGRNGPCLVIAGRWEFTSRTRDRLYYIATAIGVASTVARFW